MPRGTHHPPELRDEALRLYAEGNTMRKVAQRLRVHPATIQTWIRNARDVPADTIADNWARLAERAQPSERAIRVAPPIDERSAEHLGQQLYDTAIATLDALTARAVATADPEWIKAQSADALAELDAVQGNWVIRIISAFRAETQGPDEGSTEASDGSDAQPELHRNGAVDPAG